MYLTYFISLRLRIKWDVPLLLTEQPPNKKKGERPEGPSLFFARYNASEPGY